MNTKQALVSNALAAGTSYKEFREEVSNHAKLKTTTGPNQTDALINYTKLNDARMRRLDKTTKISEIHQTLFSNYQKKVTWLVLTESWCGDAAQSLPVLNKIAAITPHLTLKVVLRDAHIDLMQHFLTNGAMAIPKLIAIDEVSGVIIGQWGPRPSEATKMVAHYKAANGSLSPEFKKDLQIWYTKDKGQSVIDDITRMLT